MAIATMSQRAFAGLQTGASFAKSAEPTKVDEFLHNLVEEVTALLDKATIVAIPQKHSIQIITTWKKGTTWLHFYEDRMILQHGNNHFTKYEYDDPQVFNNIIAEIKELRKHRAPECTKRPND
jgi:hypothetical protein